MPAVKVAQYSFLIFRILAFTLFLTPLYLCSSIGDRPFRYLKYASRFSLASRLTSAVYHGVVFLGEFLFTVLFPKATTAPFFMFC